MRRFSLASSAALAGILLFTALWSACGSGSSSSSYTVTSFTFSPTLISLEPGQVVTVAATPYNAAGTTVSTTITYTSSDPTHADITQGGSLCAGTWDATFTLCTPTTQVGQFKITATANGANGTAIAYIHYPVTAVYLHAPSASCTSMGKTTGVTAYACTSPAYAGGTCSSACPDDPASCNITDQIGGFSYNVLDSTVASIDASGNLTAGIPGTTKMYASVNSATKSSTSTAVPYTTCLVDSISLHVQGKTDTSFTVTAAATSPLQADVLDSSGTPITPSLTFNSLQPAVGTVSGATSTGTYTGKGPGYGGVVASCTPPGCNKNVAAVFSNVVTSTVQSSASAVVANETNVYVSGLGAVQMYPVDTTNYTVGTVISLPSSPNSMVMSPDGTHIFMGSATAGMVVTTASNTVQALSFPGKVLAVSPNGAYVLFANTTTSPVSGSVYVMSGTSLTIANPGGFSIPGVSAASFTPDGNTVYFAAGANLYRYRIVGDAGSSPVPLTLTPGGNPLPGAARDLKTSANGSIVFASAGTNVVADETCNTLSAGQFIAGFEPLTTNNFAAPTALAALPNGSGMLAVDGTHLDQVNITNPNPLTSPFAGCPATGFATSPGTISLSALGSGFTVNQLLISPSGHYAAVLTGCTSGCTPQVGIIDLTNGTVNAVALVDKGSNSLTQVYNGSFMLDDSGLWVGADDSYIHFVSTSTFADTQQVNVQIQGPSSGSNLNFVNPSLLAVQPK